jgi:hypothetical protein
MCSYICYRFHCGCDYFMVSDSIEFCSSRIFSGYTFDGWSNDMCEQQVIEFAGISSRYCSECSEDHFMELEE